VRNVIKIEHPTRGDPLRGLISSGIIPGAQGLNFFIENGSRNKAQRRARSRNDRGREILYALVKKSDVFLTSFLPPARRRLKIRVRGLEEDQSKIIYAKGSGQGPKGPEAERGGFDAGSFWVARQRGPHAQRARKPPIMQRAAFGDTIGATFIAGGIAAALYHREKDRRGSVVDVSLLARGMVDGPDILAALLLGHDLPHNDRSRAPIR